jgi:hypothetical protein
MPEIVEIPIELTRFQLPQAVQARLQFLLDRQDEGYTLSQAERQEAEGLVELVEFLSLLRLRSTRVMNERSPFPPSEGKIGVRTILQCEPSSTTYPEQILK